MIPELGNFALILALALALLLAVIPLLGAALQHNGLMAFDRPLASGIFVLVALSYGCLTWAFMTDDFTVAYAASNSNSLLPWFYKFSAVWGGHEGSLLLWVLTLAGWMLAVAMFSRNLPVDMRARVLGVLGMVAVGFLLFILATSNPFDRLLPGASDGADLNPLLQDFGLIVHPPMLYMGYVGFSVTFAFAIAALMSGRLDAVWARWSRPWTTVAWSFLTIGIALGSWWAYYELGWGGWWFWDPVENASFMPWLVGTALIHSLAVTEKRGIFKSWTVLLAIMAFSLSLLGTFLVRSGVLTSVHAFASDPTRGQFVLALLGITVVGSLLLYAFRAPAVSSRASYTLLSRESFLLMNNVFLVVAMLSVLLGTLYPLILDFFGGGKISVGEPYFNFAFVPLTLALGLIMGIGIFSRWKRTAAETLIGKVLLPAVVSVLAATALPWALGFELELRTVLGLAVAAWIATMTALDLWQRSASRHGRWHGARRQSRSYMGMVLGHLGMALAIAGATMVSMQGVERDIRMSPGDSAQVAGLEWTFVGMRERQGPNFIANQGRFDIRRDGRLVTTVLPEKRQYLVQNSIMTNAGIDPGLFRDLFVALGEPVDGAQAWAVRIQYKPLIRWIWLGAIFMAVGGILAVSDKRYRVRQRVQQRASNKATDRSGAGTLQEAN